MGPKERDSQKCNFSLLHYDYILRLGLRVGYRFLPLAEFAKKKVGQGHRVVLLRHDVDTEPTRALEMAKIETRRNVKSTFFVRVHADYNPFSYKVYAALRRIADMGHEIGLHYESVDFAMVTGEDPLAVFVKEKRTLETILGARIWGIAPHRDFTGVNNMDLREKHPRPKVPIKYDAYDERFFEQFLYVSDSRAVWMTQRQGQAEPEKGRCACQYISRGIPRLYVLSHPQYWYRTSYHLD